MQAYIVTPTLRFLLNVTDFRGFHKISNIEFNNLRFLDIEDETMSLTTCIALCSSSNVAPFYAMVIGQRCVCAAGNNIYRNKQNI